MMVWRSLIGGGRSVLVWVLPNGWFVTTDGRVYPWTGYWPGVTGEDPEGGTTASGTDDLTLTVSLEYQGQQETISFRQSLAPYKRNLEHIDITPGPMVLVGSGAYVASGQDVVLFRDENDPSVWYYNQQGNYSPGGPGGPTGTNVVMTQGLGTDKGGPVVLHRFTFPGNRYPGDRNDFYTQAFVT